MTTRHPTARRVHREAAPDDVFVAGVLETGAWAKKHGRTLIIAGIVAAVAIIAVVYTISANRSREAAAALQLTQVRAVALSGNTQLSVRELEQFLQQFGSTKAADEARLLLGKAYLDAGQAQQAQETVAPLAGNVDNALGVNGALLLAGAYEAAQEPHRAEEVYLRIADGAPMLFQQQDALDNAARIRLQRGDAAGAVELYRRALDLTPIGNPERPVLELRLGEATAAAAVGGPTNAAPPTAPAAATPQPPAGTPQPPTAPQTPPGNQPD